MDHHLGVPLPVGVQHGGQLGEAQGFDGPDVESSVQLPGVRNGEPGLVHLLEHVVGVLQKLHAPGGQRDVLPDPVKQSGVQLILQLPDLHRHRRLGVPQALRSPGKTFQLCHLNKRAELPQLHAKPLLLPPQEASLNFFKSSY